MKKTSKKILALLFALVIISSAALPAVYAAVLKFNETKLTLIVGNSATLKFDGANKTPKWKSSNQKVASVSKRGVVTALKKGKTTVTAELGKVKFKCVVTVEDPVLCVRFKRGEKLNLSYYGTSQSVKWSSSNKKVASVSKNGIVRALGAGKCNITAKIGSNKYVYRVIVEAPSTTKESVATTTTNPMVDAKKVSVGVSDVAFSGKKVILSITGGKFKSNSAVISVKINGENYSNIPCRTNEKNTDVLGNQQIIVDLSSVSELREGSSVSFIIPSGFLRSQDGKTYNKAFGASATA